MKIVLHTPFGSASEEAGILYLLSNYLKTLGAETIQLRCNGVFSLCDRDAETGWKRGISTCFQCMHNQQNLAAWAGMATEELSRYLSADEIQESKRWIVSLSSDRLLKADFEGVNIYSICRTNFKNRFGIDDVDLQNKNHDQTLRRFMLSAVRMCLATKRFNNHQRADMSLVAGGKDFLSSAFIAQCVKQGREAALFQWDVSSRSVKIIHPKSQTIFPCGIILQDLSTVRSDSRTWPPELMKVIGEILDFLGLTETLITSPAPDGAVANS